MYIYILREPRVRLVYFTNRVTPVVSGVLSSGVLSCGVLSVWGFVLWGFVRTPMGTGAEMKAEEKIFG